MENSSIDYKKMADCFEELLTADRNDWDNFHEEFVQILAKHGYSECLTNDERKWFKDNIESGEYKESLTDYVFFYNCD